MIFNIKLLFFTTSLLTGGVLINDQGKMSIKGGNIIGDKSCWLADRRAMGYMISWMEDGR